MGLLQTVTLALAASSGLVAADGLNARAQKIGKYFGTEYSVNQLSDGTFMNIANNKEEFGAVTPENEMKWDATEPNRGQFSYGNGDRIANSATSAGQLLRCHTTVWHSQLPNWVRNGYDNQTMISIMNTHITNLMTHWKGKCKHWDVVNEALEEDGSYRRSNSPFYSTIGEAFIPIAFRTAAAADPDAKLFYNDYNIELAGSKSSGAQRIVRLIKQYGARIDGVGLQAHLVVGQVPSYTQYQSNLKAFTDLGVDVAYTELDIRMNLPSDNGKLQQQATDYGNVVKACALTPKCLGITTWGLTDKYSWVPNTFSGTGDALPWNSNFQKKPAYTAILSALDAGTSVSTSTASTTSVPNTSQPPVTTTTTSSSTSTTFATSTTSSAGTGTCSGMWGQCGGLGWNGPKCCSAGTCKYSNDWYSQCL
jgi:endo-1,4-beta-xylanase